MQMVMARFNANVRYSGLLYAASQEVGSVISVLMVICGLFEGTDWLSIPYLR